MKLYLSLLVSLFLWTNVLKAKFTFSPYYSVTSTKAIKANAKTDSETERITQREEKGLRAGVGFFRILSLNLSIGQSFLTTTSTESEIKDEYEEIDFDTELDTSTRVPGKETKKKETQNKARVTFVFDPGFWIFIARLKLGVTARQRIVEISEDDVKLSRVEPPITYKPHAGAGLGIKLGRRMFFMIEYGVYFFKFPDTEPFEREATISYAFSI